MREGGLRRRRVTGQTGVPDPLKDKGRRCALRREANGGLLGQARLPGRRHAAELLARLRAAQAGTGRVTLSEALRDAVLAAVGVLTALNDAVKSLDRSVAAHFGEHPDGKIFTSLPRSGQVNVARCSPSEATAAKLTTAPSAPLPLHARHQTVRKAPGRELPLSLQQALPCRDDHLRRQQKTRQPLGREDLQRSPRQRQRPPHAPHLPTTGSASSGPAGSQRPQDPARHGAATELEEQPAKKIAD